MIDTFTWLDALTGLAGGVLIGLASTLLLLGNGRIAGISGILGGLFAREAGDITWRALFVAGLIGGAGLFILISGGPLDVQVDMGIPGLIVAGLLVGFGTRLGSGCTSGHGVCGMARLSKRSITATVTFMLMAGITVYVTRHLLGLGGF